MTKISNQIAYIPDEEINGLDYLPGTDVDSGLKTVNFRVKDLGTHYNQANGVRNFDFNFYEHLELTATPKDGCFYSNGNNQNPENITHFIFSKKTASNKNIFQFFESIAIDNPFDLVVSQKIGINTIFFFKITSIETFSNYYKLNVTEVFFPINNILEYTSSNTIFNLKAVGGSSVPQNQIVREEFLFNGSQTFTLISDFSQVYSVEVKGQGALSTSQYNLLAPNQFEILDQLEIDDYIVVIYSNGIVGTSPYYTQSQVDNLIQNLPKQVNNSFVLGIVNGVNNIFTISETIIPNSEELFVNGLKLAKPNDYNISGTTITLTFSPNTDEVISINYLKQ